MTTFDELATATGLPEAALAPIKSKFDEAFNLIVLNNKRVAAVNAAKAQDPTKPGYEEELDKLWKLHEKSDAEIVPIAEEFYLIAERYEKLQGQLRDLAKKHIPEVLSEDDAKKTRNLINESAPTISTAIAQAKAMVTVLDSMLAIGNKGIEGGVISLLPELDSLKNTRGRKGSTGEKGYATRIGNFEIDGTKVEVDGKVNLRFGAAALSEKFGSGTYPDNKVTGEEVEEAYFKAIGKDFRSLKSPEIPESTTFDFTKEVKIGEGKTETRTVKITIGRVVSDATPAKAEETPAAKVEAKVEDKQETPAATPAAKKTTPPAKK